MTRDPDRRRGRHRPSTVDEDILAMLRESGLSLAGPDRDLTVDEKERTDAAAEGALARILESPRDPSPDWTPAAAPQAEARPAPGTPVRFSKLRERRVPLLVGAGILVGAATATAVFVGMPGAESPPRESGPEVVANGVTPPMGDFALVAHTSDLQGSPADDALRGLAEVASRQPAPDTGGVQHVRLDGWFLTQEDSASSTLVPTVTDRYFLPDGQYRTIEAHGAPLDGYGRVVDPAEVSDPISDDTFHGPAEGVDHARTLPTEARALISRLIPDPGECPVLAECLTSQLINVQYTWVAPPKLTAALWSTLIGETEVSYLGETTDRLGRQAIGFATPTSDGHRKVVLYADPDTGALLGSEEVLLTREEGDGLPAAVEPPVVINFTALAESEWISVDDLPRD